MAVEPLGSSTMVSRSLVTLLIICLVQGRLEKNDEYVSKSWHISVMYSLVF